MTDVIDPAHGKPFPTKGEADTVSAKTFGSGITEALGVRMHGLVVMLHGYAPLVIHVPDERTLDSLQDAVNAVRARMHYIQPLEKTNRKENPPDA